MQNPLITMANGATIKIKEVSLSEETEEFLVDYDIEGEASQEDIQQALEKWFNDTLDYIIKEAATAD